MIVRYVKFKEQSLFTMPCDLRQQVWDWATQQGIELEGEDYGVNGNDIWRVKDDRHCMLFVLKWA